MTRTELRAQLQSLTNAVAYLKPETSFTSEQTAQVRAALDRVRFVLIEVQRKEPQP